jgi:hypothetical protein
MARKKVFDIDASMLVDRRPALTRPGAAFIIIDSVLGEAMIEGGLTRGSELRFHDATYYADAHLAPKLSFSSNLDIWAYPFTGLLFEGLEGS